MDTSIIADRELINETIGGFAQFETLYKTTDLRNHTKILDVGFRETRLQQKWISDRGNEKWEFIPEFVE